MKKSNITQKIVWLRRKIHQRPELGGREFHTSRLIERELQRVGIVTKRLNKTGISGLIQGGKEGRTVGLRADIDALPIQEQNTQSYKSQIANVMHACGHDGNTAIVFGTGLILNQNRNGFNGNVKIFFQPDEESADGARNLIRSGVLKNPEVDTVFGIHVNPELRTGQVGIRYGTMFAAVDRFTLRIIGEGGHAAYPHKGKDAVVIATEIIQAVQHIVSRRVNPVNPVVITFGTINGGERFNILAKEVVLTGTVRTLDYQTHRLIPQLMQRTIKHICATWSAKYKLDYEVIASPLTNTDKIVDFVYQYAIEKLGKSQVVLVKNPSLGGEDFAEYLRYCPGCFMYIGTGGKDKTTRYAWHHNRFNLDEQAMYPAALFLSGLIQTYLGSAEK